MKGPSEGIRVEASILARLLGIKLLKLDATILVLPAEGIEASPQPANLVVRAPLVGVTRTGADRGAPRDARLADAIESLNEGARLLEEARRDGS